MNDTAAPLAFRNLLSGLLRAPLRFPVPLGCAVSWAVSMIALEHRLYFVDKPTLHRIQVFLILGLFLSLSVKLFAESRNWSIVRWLPLTAGALGLLALIVFLGPQTRDAYDSPAFLFMGPALILLMIVSPFLRRGAENRLIWDFNFKSWTSAAFGLLVALVIAFGTVAALAALEELFRLNISGKIYFDVWIVCLSVIWPWQTLAGVPGGFGAAKEEYCPRWATYLIGWMLVPLALLYLALLYAFAAKIAVQWSLPEGQIGWLVAGFAGFGLAVWHAAHPLRETGTRLVRLYVRFFHPALFVPIALLAVGISARVADYGITENRYGLMVLTLWLAGIAVHGVIVRAPRLNVAPISFAVLLILGSFGPWGASSVSLHSQLARLDVLLVEAGVLRGGKLSAPTKPVDTDIAKRISGVVDYLNRPGKRQALSVHLRDGGTELVAGSSSADIVAALGMKYIKHARDPGYQSWSRPDLGVMDLRGFDAAVQMRLRWWESGNSEPVKIGDSGTRVHTTASDNTLRISTTTHGPVSIDLAQIVEILRRDGSRRPNSAINAPLMTVEARGNGLKTRVYFTSINGEGPTGALKVGYLSFIALVGLDEES